MRCLSARAELSGQVSVGGSFRGPRCGCLRSIRARTGGVKKGHSRFPMGILDGPFLRSAEANLADANLRGADMEEVDLHGADLHGGVLAEPHLRDADLHGAV